VDDVPTFIAEYVARFFEARGVAIPWLRTNVDCAIEIGTYVQSSEKTLEWLRTQVKPALGRLIVEGREQEAMEALGLPLPGIVGYLKEVF